MVLRIASPVVFLVATSPYQRATVWFEAWPNDTSAAVAKGRGHPGDAGNTFMSGIHLRMCTDIQLVMRTVLVEEIHVIRSASVFPCLRNGVSY